MNDKQKHRIEFLDNIFQGIKRYTVNQIVDLYSRNHEVVSRRTIYNDIEYMQNHELWDEPIQTNRVGKEVYYTYKDKNFSINKINSQEEKKLLQALTALSHFKGLPEFNWTEDILIKLNSKFSLNDKQTVVLFDDIEDFKGSEYLSPIYNAIIEKQVLKITYQPFHKEFTSILTFHPYLLKKFNNRWFVYGLSEYQKSDGTHQNIINIGLDRIENISVATNIQYIENADSEFIERFDNIIGVTYKPDAPVEKVIFHVSNYRYPHIVTKPLHPYQHELKSQHTGTYKVFSLDVQINNELEALILSYGNDIEVVEPASFRHRIAEKVKLMHNLYENLP